MKKIRSLIVIMVSIVLTVFAALYNAVNPGGGSEVADLGLHETLAGMTRAIEGAAGTYVYMSESNPLIVLGWTEGSQAAWVMVDRAGNIMDQLSDICGNVSCPDNATDLLLWMENNGWKLVPPAGLAKALPAELVTSVQKTVALLSGSTGAVSTGGFPTVFLVPVDLFTRSLNPASQGPQ